jgi:hypothetical protein
MQNELNVYRELNLQQARPTVAPTPPAPTVSLPAQPAPYLVPTVKYTTKEQDQFVAALIALNASLDKEKQDIEERRKIVADLITRNSGALQQQPTSARQWTPEQQRMIADLLTRDVKSAYNLSQSRISSIDQRDQRIAELLTRSAELDYDRTRVTERQALLNELTVLNATLNAQYQRIEGQQRLIAELVTNSMGVSTGADTKEKIGKELLSLESQMSTDVTAEYLVLLNKAKLLWTLITNQSNAQPSGGGGY